MGNAVRTCVACRERTNPDTMIRLVRHPSGIAVVDEKRRLPGRGAWCHASGDCIDLLVKRSAGLQRALRGSIDMYRLATDIRLWLARRLSDGLSLAFAGRCAVVGQERMLEAMAGGGVACVAISTDISPRTVRGLKAGATSGELFVEVPYSSAELGALLGGELYAAVAILHGPATNNVLLRLRQWSALG